VRIATVVLALAQLTRLIAWVFGSVAVTFDVGISFVMLLATLRFLGIGDSELPTVELFAIVAPAFLAETLIPLTASGLGVAS
jgi:hypothetical protein